MRLVLVLVAASAYWNEFRRWPLADWYRSPFLTEAAICTPTPDGDDYCLHRAAAEANIKAIRYLHKHGAKLEARDSTGDTPLYVAATTYGGDVDAVRCLLQLGADANAVNDYGYSPIHAAAYLGKPAIARLLVDKDVDLECADFEGLTPLHKCARSNRSDATLVLRLLLDEGAAVDARDRYGNTPLHLAVPTLERDRVALLIDCGADRSARNAAGVTPLDVWETLSAAVQKEDHGAYREIGGLLSN